MNSAHTHTQYCVFIRKDFILYVDIPLSANNCMNNEALLVNEVERERGFYYVCGKLFKLLLLLTMLSEMEHY